MFERNSLAVTCCSSSGPADLSRQERINSIAYNFGMCSWRPDSETVASRAFAQTSAEIKGFRGQHSAKSVESFEVEDYSGIFRMALFSASAVFGPKGALSLGIEVKPRVFGSVSRNRIRLGNHVGCSSRNIEFASKWFGLQTNS